MYLSEPHTHTLTHTALKVHLTVTIGMRLMEQCKQIMHLSISKMVVVSCLSENTKAQADGTQ